MARFLSAEWFEEISGHPVESRAVRVVPAQGDLVLQQVVTGTPDGEVRYQVLLTAGGSRLRAGAEETPDVTFTSDYPTASAIARGVLSTQAALLDGRIRIAGNMAQLVRHQPHLNGLDVVPGAVRAETTF